MVPRSYIHSNGKQTICLNLNDTMSMEHFLYFKEMEHSFFQFEIKGMNVMLNVGVHKCDGIKNR